MFRQLSNRYWIHGSTLADSAIKHKKATSPNDSLGPSSFLWQPTYTYESARFRLYFFFPAALAASAAAFNSWSASIKSCLAFCA